MTCPQPDSDEWSAIAVSDRQQPVEKLEKKFPVPQGTRVVEVEIDW